MKTSKTLLAEATKKAQQIHREIQLGQTGYPLFHRIHLTTDGKVMETVAANPGVVDPDEYFQKAPHDLTLWEIDAQKIGTFDPSESYGDEKVLGCICRERKPKQFADLPVDPDKWTPKQQITVLEEFIDVSFPTPSEIAEKSQLLEAWAKTNLRTPTRRLTLA